MHRTLVDEELTREKTPKKKLILIPSKTFIGKTRK
jgi:hypothetical protein